MFVMVAYRRRRRLFGAELSRGDGGTEQLRRLPRQRRRSPRTQKAFAACAKRLERSGVDLTGYTLAEQADDINAARVALGYKRIDLFSESAGPSRDDLPMAGTRTPSTARS